MNRQPADTPQRRNAFLA